MKLKWHNQYDKKLSAMSDKLTKTIGELDDFELFKYFSEINPLVFQLEVLRNYAVTNENYEMIQYMIDNRDTLRYNPNIQIDPVHFLLEAIRQDKRSVMRFILDNWELDSLGINYALDASARMGQIDLIEYFESIGATDVDSAFRASVQNGAIASVLYFLSRNIGDLDTALDQAVGARNIPMTRYLLDHGPDPSTITSTIEKIPSERYKFPREFDILKLLEQTLDHITENTPGSKLRVKYKNFLRERNQMITQLRQQGSTELPTTEGILKNLNPKKQMKLLIL